MTLTIEHWNVENDGEISEMAMREKLERKGYSVTRYIYPPGTYFPDHAHEVDKIDGVLSGQFMLRVEGEAVILEAGDTLELPHGTLHSAEVVGHEPVISLDAVRE
ncbi:MAG: cupin domain-containing protein [Gammaproteobacteria bacterium]|nr:cupin domain-containing protein [Gammaproteobacteria bacterium]